MNTTELPAESEAAPVVAVHEASLRRAGSTLRSALACPPAAEPVIPRGCSC
ncbi:MAG TPA: hypothetical protein VLR26_00285 [Frankiaceae bacterium]|nr:hypothetical protein [Frankiaceae bacterium]